MFDFLYNNNNNPQPQPAPQPAPNPESEQQNEGAQQIEASFKQLLDDIKIETMREYNDKLFSAMNIWLTIGAMHPDKRLQTMYLTMSKSIALLINRSYLSPENIEKCNKAASYMPPED